MSVGTEVGRKLNDYMDDCWERDAHVVTEPGRAFTRCNVCGCESAGGPPTPEPDKAALIDAGDAMAAELARKGKPPQTVAVAPVVRTSIAATGGRRESYEGAPGIDATCIKRDGVVLLKLEGSPGSAFEFRVAVADVQGAKDGPLAFDTKWTPGR
jgi:hypothetical protein